MSVSLIYLYWFICGDKSLSSCKLPTPPKKQNILSGTNANWLYSIHFSFDKFVIVSLADGHKLNLISMIKLSKHVKRLFSSNANWLYNPTSLTWQSWKYGQWSQNNSNLSESAEEEIHSHHVSLQPLHKNKHMVWYQCNQAIDAHTHVAKL